MNSVQNGGMVAQDGMGNANRYGKGEEGEGTARAWIWKTENRFKSIATSILDKAVTRTRDGPCPELQRTWCLPFRLGSTCAS